MINKDSLYEMRHYAEKLSKGIDPTTDMAFSEDTILNSNKIKNYNKNVLKLLDNFINEKVEESEENPQKNSKKKQPFYYLDSQISSFEISDEPISISEITYKINGKLSKDIRKIRAFEITSWLVSEGYLEVCAYGDDRNYKRTTAKGESIGIVFCEKVNKYGNEYGVNTYNKNAQTFIVGNINQIIQ